MTSTPPVTATGASRPIWVAIIVLTAVLIGTTTGLLSAAGGVPTPLALIAGGGAFGGATALLLSIAQFLTGTKA